MGESTARFWAKVEKRGPDECWEWAGSRERWGYGQFWVGGGMRSSHRIAWEITNGPIPSGMFVCHRCDNPPCCNPKHLFLGTCADNNRDMVEKGRARAASGERNGNAKLTEDDVRAIRRQAARESQADLARIYGVCKPIISKILRRKAWTHI